MENEVSTVDLVNKGTTELNENQHLVQGTTNKNKKHKNSDMELLRSFLAANGERRLIKRIPVTELNHLLCNFFINGRREDGSDFEPETLLRIMSSIDQYLNKKEYGFSVKLSAEFFHVRMVLDKRQQLFRQNLLNRDGESETISEINDIKMLWEQGQFGSHTPDSIINTLWFYTSLYFDLRWPKEHKLLNWGDVKLCCDASGHEYLEYTKKCTRNQTEEKKKMFANSQEPNVCPVNVYKIYASLRPVCYCCGNDPFYISAIRVYRHNRTEKQWFKRQPISVSNLASIMKRITMLAGISVEKMNV